MIINSDNKKNIINGTMKRGFMQDPLEIRNRINHNLKENKKAEVKEDSQKEKPEELQRKIAALKNLTHNKF